MARKSRRNKSIQRDPPRPKPANLAREVPAALLVESKIRRMTQSEILQDLIQKYHGEIPVVKLHELRAIRLQPMRVL